MFPAAPNMHVALLTVEIQLFDARSLKDKRSALARLRADMRGKFNVSFAEAGHQDLWQRATVALAFIAPHADAAHAEAEGILKHIEARFRAGQVTGHDLVLY